MTPNDAPPLEPLAVSAHDACIVVRDTGQGISPEFLPFVFDRFRQGDPSTRRSHGGLGIGLAVVRSLSEMHGGRVTAESAGPGRGSAFTVTLPRSTRSMSSTVAGPGTAQSLQALEPKGEWL